MTRLFPACLATFALAAMALPAAAEMADDIVSLEVLPGWRTDAGTRMVGLQLTLLPGWKTYWRAPGDGGIPPQMTWGGSHNIETARFHWPVPDVFEVGGMRSIGYHDQVVIPIELSTASPDAPSRMSGALDIGVCMDICVPVELSFDLTLEGAGSRDAAIVAALVDRPMTGAEAGVSGVTCQLSPTENGLHIVATIMMPQAGSNEVVVIETNDPNVWVSEPVAVRAGGTLTAEAEMIHLEGGAFAVDRSALRFTVLGSAQAVDVMGCTG